MAPMKKLPPAPQDVLAAVRRAEPQLPPAVADASDPTCALNLRLRVSSVVAIEQVAVAQGISMKLVIMQALHAAGIKVAEVDLEDRSPEKVRKRGR